MKRLAPILFLAAAIPGIAPAVEWGLPWFHTRPKPVLLDDQTGKTVSQKTVKHVDFKSSDENARPAWTESWRSRDSQHGQTDLKSKSSAMPAPTR